MSQDARRGRRRRNEAVQPDQAALDAVGEVLDTQLADLVAYCRGLTSGEEDAVSTAHTVMDSAQSLLQDPERLRAWLFALARRETLADGKPEAQEILDLIHRHGIQPRDLPVVLGIPAVEADQRLAAAEQEHASRPDDNDDRGSANGWHDSPGWDDSSGSPDDDPARPDDTAWPDPPAKHGSRRSSGGWGTLASSRARLAAASATVVAVIGVGAAYLAYSGHGGQPSPAGLQQTTRDPSPAGGSPSPASTPSPTPTASPRRSPAPSHPVIVVPPPPAPTSTKPTPKPSPTHSTSTPPTSPPPTTPPPTSPPPSPSTSP